MRGNLRWRPRPEVGTRVRVWVGGTVRGYWFTGTVTALPNDPIPGVVVTADDGEILTASPSEVRLDREGQA